MGLENKVDAEGKLVEVDSGSIESNYNKEIHEFFKSIYDTTDEHKTVLNQLSPEELESIDFTVNCFHNARVAYWKELFYQEHLERPDHRLTHEYRTAVNNLCRGAYVFGVLISTLLSIRVGPQSYALLNSMAMLATWAVLGNPVFGGVQQILQENEHCKALYNQFSKYTYAEARKEYLIACEDVREALSQLPESDAVSEALSAFNPKSCARRISALSGTEPILQLEA